MMRRASFPSFVLPLALLVLIIVCRCGSASNDVIDTTCKKTRNYSLCVSTLNSAPGSATADPAGLAVIALEVLLPKANTTFQLALKLWKEVSGGSDLYRFYGTCVDVYGNSVTNIIPEAVSDVKSKKFSAARDDAVSVAGKADFCDGQFAKTTPLTAGNHEVRDLANLAADIIGSLG